MIILAILSGMVNILLVLKVVFMLEMGNINLISKIFMSNKKMVGNIDHFFAFSK